MIFIVSFLSALFILSLGSSHIFGLFYSIFCIFWSFFVSQPIVSAVPKLKFFNVVRLFSLCAAIVFYTQSLFKTDVRIFLLFTHDYPQFGLKSEFHGMWG